MADTYNAIDELSQMPVPIGFLLGIMALTATVWLVNGLQYAYEVVAYRFGKAFERRRVMGELDHVEAAGLSEIDLNSSAAIWAGKDELRQKLYLKVLVQAVTDKQMRNRGAPLGASGFVLNSRQITGDTHVKLKELRRFLLGRLS